MKRSAHSPRIFCFALLAGLALAGCRNPKPVTYQVPKEVDSAVADRPPAAAQPAGTPPGHPDIGNAGAPADPMAGQMVAPSIGGALQWTAPAHWKTKAVSSMRRGSYDVAGENGTVADLAITAFPGDVGGEVANVNRWRGQLQLGPLPEAEARAAITRVTYHGLAIGVVDVANAATPVAERILGAMVPFDGSTWFFKLKGPDPLVEKEKAAFLAFLQTVQPASPTP